MLCNSVCRRTSSAWLVSDGVELETLVSNLQPGDIIAVREGEVVPVDGRIVSGTGILEESPVRGTQGFVYCGTGDGVYESSILVEGELRIEVLRSGMATVVTTIDRALLATTAGASNPQTEFPPAFAEHAVPPVLMTAGLGLLVGDMGVALTVLRPDYTTGPVLGDSLTLIERLGSCLDQGIIVRRPSVFERMASADVVAFDHDRLLETRVLQLDEIQISGPLSVDVVLEYAACGLRHFHDPRARAVVAALATYGRTPLSLPLQHLSGGVEFVHAGRTIQVAGLESAEAGAPLHVFADGQPAGSLTFCKGIACAATAAVLKLRTRCGMAVELLSSAAADQSQPLADALGADGVYSCPSDESRADVIRNLRAGGRRVVFVGDCRRSPLAAHAADVAVFPFPDPAWDADPSGVWLWHASYEKLVDLRELSVSMCRQSELHRNLILIPNLVCIAGAFLFGFTGLAAVVLSNLGTYSVYFRSRAALRRTERRLQDRRRRIIQKSSSPRTGEAPRRLTLQEAW
jgi:Cu2+-exporting ATPase